MTIYIYIWLLWKQSNEHMIRIIKQYKRKHPGGDKNLFRVCGIDATEIFERQHGNNKQANNALAGFEIGTLTK